MFDVLIREAGARFGVGDKALPLVQMLLAYMTDKNTGGLAGFLEKFKAAGHGPIIQSWLGGGPSAQPITNSQIETVLGNSGGLLSLITSRLDLGRDNVTSALTYLLPNIVGKLTPGGSIPSSLPPEVTALATAGHGLLAAPAVAAAPAAAGGGMMKWLPWLVAGIVALVGLSYCSKNRTEQTPADTPPALEAPADPAPAASEPPPVAVFGGGAPAASEPVPPATEPAAPATEPATQPATQPAVEPASAPAAASDAAVPTGAAVVAHAANDRPGLNVYFDSGSTAVHGDFAAKAHDLVEAMKATPGLQAVISGYNDPTGNAAANAELSKNRAQAVQKALVDLGIAEDRTVLEKPAETTGTADSNAAARRVEVVLREGV
ncbi:MAG: YidB family protein [Pseudomonadota bacterium]|nr:YidB family protein [Pseudomonadota bacterium]